jgi:RimJ/RimL family protein N-acetyltransferase
MTRRHEYILDLTNFDGGPSFPPVPEIALRAPDRADLDALAVLMIEAYRGTIDYDGETLPDAIAEVQAYFAGERGGSPLLNASRLGFVEGRLVGACLAANWDNRGVPLIAYVMTDGAWKLRGAASQLLGQVLVALHAEGFREVRAVITEGNLPSEKLFGRMNFSRVT